MASQAVRFNLWRLLGVPRLLMRATRLHFPLCQLASCCKRFACAPRQADAGGDTHHQAKRSCSARPFIVVMNRNSRFTWTRCYPEPWPDMARPLDEDWSNSAYSIAAVSQHDTKPAGAKILQNRIKKYLASSPARPRRWQVCLIRPSDPMHSDLCTTKLE